MFIDATAYGVRREPFAISICRGPGRLRVRSERDGLTLTTNSKVKATFSLNVPDILLH